MARSALTTSRSQSAAVLAGQAAAALQDAPRVLGALERASVKPALDAARPRVMLSS
jgi:hypothetical protein